MAMRRGFFFTSDALLALLLLATGFLAIGMLYFHKEPTTHTNFLPQDMLAILSGTPVTGLDNPYIELLIANGTIPESELENTVLEQIGVMWVRNQSEAVILLLENITAGLIPDRYGFSIMFEDDILYIKNTSTETELVSYKNLITGLEKARPIKGTSARIYLTGGEEKLTRSSYAYFGGFEGQGNVTKVLRDIPADANMTSVYMEASESGNFTLFINNQVCSWLEANPSPMTAAGYNLTNCSLLLVGGADNNFTILFDDQTTAYVAGGFIRADYYTDQVFYKDVASETYHFPGISGIINIYSAAEVPGILNSMSAYLHYHAPHTNLSNNTLSLIIGNTLVYSDSNSTGEMNITLDNANLSAALAYGFISNQTVPIRFGYENLSFVQVASDKGNGDVVVVNDVSGSMNWRFDSTATGAERFCKMPELTESSTQRLSVLKCIIRDFIGQILLNVSGNRMGIVSYSSAVRDSLSLTRNETLAENQISQYYASGGTCTSCGVYEGVRQLLAGRQTDLLHNTWRYTNGFQAGDPAGWANEGFDDSSWLAGSPDFGFGYGADIFTGNVLQAYLFPYQGDRENPVDFERGILSTGNTFGFSNNATVELISGGDFSGPSIAGWASEGAVATESERITELFYDDFNRAANDNLGADWTEVQNGGNWRILNNMLVESTNSAPGNRDLGSGPLAYNNLGAGWTDYTVTATLRPNDNDCIGLLFRYQDEDNHYRFRIDNDPSGGTFTRIERIQGGMRTILWENPDTSSGFGTNSWNSMRVTVRQDTIKAFRGTTEIATVTDNAFPAGTAAVYSWAMDDGIYGADFDEINVSSNVFGMDDYVIIDSDLGASGSLSIGFTSPTASPHSATLLLNYSTDDAYFTGSALAFCNITHPGGEAIAWQTYMTAANNTASVQVSADITSLITSSAFGYTLECGAFVDAAGGRTIVALDDIHILLSYSPPLSTYDDGWDWQAGVFGYSHAQFFPLGKGNLEMAVNSSSAASGSGAWGVQFNITPEMHSAMQSGTATIAFDYRWDPADDGSSSLFDSDDEVWVKGYIMDSAGAVTYLGSETSSVGGDTGQEIWSATDPDTERASHYAQDITSVITGPGYYYLALGGRLLRDAVSKSGTFTFDNIQLAVTNSSGNTFYRNTFFVFNVSEIGTPFYLNITSDGGADCYLNGIGIDSYAGAVNARITNVNPLLLHDANNVLAIKLHNSDPVGRLQAGLLANVSNRQKALLVMSDGETNACVDDGGVSDSGCDNCGGSACCPDQNGILNRPCPDIPAIVQSEFSDGDEDAAEQLVNLTCFYQKRDNLSIYTVAFGTVGLGGRRALNMTALCDPAYNSTNSTHFFESDDPGGLSTIYSQIASILRNSFSFKVLQTINIIGSYEKSYLYPDSFIRFNFTKYVPEVEYGEVPLFFEFKEPSNCTFDIFIPSQVRPIEAAVTSYSGVHWTDVVKLENSLGTFITYNLSRFSSDYSYLGDPFAVSVPAGNLVPGETNRITVSVGDEPSNVTNCSVNNSFIYTGLINVVNFTLPYSEVKFNALGCTWLIETEELNNITIRVPKSYAGTSTCTYTNMSHGPGSYNSDDSYDVAMYSLLTHLDYNNDGRVFVDFTEDDVTIDAKVVRDIPYLWGPAVMEVRAWH